MPTRIVQNDVARGSSNGHQSAKSSSSPPLQSEALVLPQPRQQVMVQQSPPRPVLKLTFGGVDFSLLPKTSRDGSVTFEAMGSNEAVLSLKNFTGALRVSCSPALLQNSSGKSNSNNLVEDSASPSPERQLVTFNKSKNPGRPSPTQQQLTSWAQRHVNSPEAAGAKSTSQSPTPTMANRKKRPSAVEQVVAANRSSPLPFASPLKRIRKPSKEFKAKTSKMAENSEPPSVNPTANSSKETQLSEHLTPSPISLTAKKSLSPLDCSQTMPSQPSNDSTEEVSERAPEEEEPQQEEERKVQSMDLVGEDESDDGTKNEESEGSKNQFHDEDETSVATRLAEEDDDDDVDDKVLSEKDAKSSGNDRDSSPKSASNIVPTPRWGHAICMIDHDRVCLYGGQALEEVENGEVFPTTQSDIYIYDMESKKWIVVDSPDKSRQIPRQWFSASYIPGRNVVLFFGGEHYNLKTGKMKCPDNSLMVLDCEILLLFSPQCSGELPNGRSGHSATLLPSTSNNELVLFGGTSRGKHLNSVCVLDTTSWVWHVPKISGSPPRARSYHTATALAACTGQHYGDSLSNGKDASIAIRHRLCIIGGNDQLRSYNTVTLLEKVEMANRIEWRWVHPAVTGDVPRARTGHAAILLEDGKTICIHGGWDPSDDDEKENKNASDDEMIFNDCYLLDTESWKWTKGSPGSRRVGHGAVRKLGSDEVLLIGGRIPGDEFTGDFEKLTVDLK